MGRRKCDPRRGKNAGFTLVELIIAMAILSVVSLAVYSFMNTGARLYQRTSSDADIQTDAQLVANTISDLVIDCEVNIRYGSDVSDEINNGTGTTYVTGDTLEIDNSNYQFVIAHVDNKLFYMQRLPDPSTGNFPAWTSDDLNKAELLAENITDFSVDLSRVKGGKRNILEFAMTYEKGGRKYAGNYQVNLRNSVTVNAIVPSAPTGDQDCTRVILQPPQIYVDVKNKTNPQPVAPGVNLNSYRRASFTAISDAKNVTSGSLFTWEIENAADCVTIPGNRGDRQCEVEVAEFLKSDTSTSADAKQIPASGQVRVIATSTVPDRSTGLYPYDDATIYFRKINSMAISSGDGVVGGKITPKSSGTFTADISGYNLASLSPNENSCTWKLQILYPGAAGYVDCTDSGFGYLRRNGLTATLVLGERATSECTFKLIATSTWDPTWSAEVTVGVEEVPPPPTVKAASRGVEIDLTELLLGTDNVKGGMPSTTNPSLHGGVKQVYKAKLTNWSGNDLSDACEFVERDGKVYFYVDFTQTRYTEGDSILNLFYGDNMNVQLEIWWRCQNYWPDKVAQCDVHCEHNTSGINIHMDKAEIMKGQPENGIMLVSSGQTGTATFKLGGYNLSKKNQIGIYLYDNGLWQNANNNEFGMNDVNKYLDVRFVSAMGDRYNLVHDGSFTIAPKPSLRKYPKDAVSVRVTLEDVYKVASANNKQDWLNSSSYQFKTYIANVEGTDLFVKGPEGDAFGSTTVVYFGDGRKAAADTINSVALGTTYQYGGNSFKFGVKKNGNKISYYTMECNGKKYYYNETYRCWKAMS